MRNRADQQHGGSLTCAPVAFIASIILSDRKYDSMEAAGPMQIASSHICEHPVNSMRPENSWMGFGGEIIVRQVWGKRQTYWAPIRLPAHGQHENLPLNRLRQF